MKTTMILLTLFANSIAFAQSTSNHQGTPQDGFRTVIGIGISTIAISANSSPKDVIIANRMAMSECESNATKKCGCGTKTILECLTRTSNFIFSGRRVEFGSPFTNIIASANFQCN